jgi:hypothetical protein
MPLNCLLSFRKLKDNVLVDEIPDLGRCLGEVKGDLDVLSFS